MAQVVHEDVVEQILIGLDVKDLVRYKRVCKSWHSIIESPRFISLQLNRSYNKDRYNNKLGHRRITLFTRPIFNYDRRSLVGSSNGLVCISFPYFSSKLIVGNPLTREVRQLQLPLGSASGYMCLGFGYDSSRDDYKVIAGSRKGENGTLVQVFSLKSNLWRVIGEVKYRLYSMDVGILCNGALHWMTRDENLKNLIIAYDLSREEFKEILQPEVAGSIGCYLGIREERLCIFGNSNYVWLMKVYNVKESWERLRSDRVMKHDLVHVLRLGLPKDADESWFSHELEHLCWEYMDAHIFVQSLVSPQTNASLKQKPLVEIMVEDPRPSATMSHLRREDPGPSASSIGMIEVIVYTLFLLLFFIIMCLPLIYLVSRLL